MATRLLLQFARRPAQIAISSVTRAQPQPIVARCVSVSVTDYFNRLKRPHLDPEFPMPPKRPPTPYALYVQENCREVMNDLGSTNVGEAMKKLAVTWNELEDQQRMKYYDRFAERTKEWDKAMDKLLSSLGTDKEAYLMKLEKYRRKRREYLLKFRQRRLGILKPRRLSARNVYLSEKLTGTQKSELNQRFAEVCTEWNNLSQEKKQKYDEEADRIYQDRLRQYEERKKEVEAVLKGTVE